MAGFVMKQMVGSKISGVKGGLDKLTGDKKEEGEGGEKTETGEDPEVVQARLEQEEKRKDKHRKMEAEREKMRTGIREKYGIKTKEQIDAERMGMDDCDGRIGAARKKTPEELASEASAEQNSLLGQLGLGGAADTAKNAIGGVADKIKGFLPFGK